MNFTLPLYPPCSFMAREQIQSWKGFSDGEAIEKVNVPIWDKELACYILAWLLPT